MQNKRWQLVKVPRDSTRACPWSVRIDGKEQYVLADVSAKQAQDIERMLNTLK